MSINDSVRIDIMNLKKTIPIVILLIPIIEIILFIEIGSVIGSFNTILTIVITAIVGVYIIKYNSAMYMSEIRSKLMKGLRPDKEILSGINNIRLWQMPSSKKVSPKSFQLSFL